MGRTVKTLEQNRRRRKGRKSNTVISIDSGAIGSKLPVIQSNELLRKIYPGMELDEILEMQKRKKVQPRSGASVIEVRAPKPEE